MPLMKGSSKKTMQKNIDELIGSDYPDHKGQAARLHIQSG
jgi:hypothetical protein